MNANIRLFPWFKFFQQLVFWQAVWFLFFQERLSAAEAILIYVAYDISTTVLEVPSGYLSDRVGRRLTLILSALGVTVAATMQAIGGPFWVYFAAQAALGAGAAFASGTDSALLYESLDREGRAAEIERHELRAWRAGFAALALSAVTGGAMAVWDPVLPFVATAVAGVVSLAIAWCFREPDRTRETVHTARSSLLALREAVRQPVLLWIFVLAAAMYTFSHVPFVFGQPFILEALSTHGFAADAPLVSGVITALMMILSVATSWAAPWLRHRLGLGGILLLALGMQVALIGALAASSHILVIGLLLFRMVPDSFSRPFKVAAIQPWLPDRVRATWLSIQSFCARLLFALSLFLLSFDTSRDAPMVYAEIRDILIWYVGAGLIVLIGLVFSMRVLRVVPR